MAETLATDKGSIEWIAAMLRQIRDGQIKNDAQQLNAFNDLLRDIATSLADITANFEQNNGTAAITRLVEALQQVQLRAPEVRVQAPDVKIDPQFTINTPTPEVRVEAIMPALPAPVVSFEAIMPALPAPPPAQVVVQPAPAYDVEFEVDFKYGVSGVEGFIVRRRVVRPNTR